MTNRFAVPSVSASKPQAVCRGGYANVTPSVVEASCGQTNTSTMTIPLYKKDQRVYFAGGAGKIKSYHLESGIWSYAVELEIELELTMEWIGNETTILLDEADIHEVMNL